MPAPAVAVSVTVSPSHTTDGPSNVTTGAGGVGATSTSTEAVPVQPPVVPVTAYTPEAATSSAAPVVPSDHNQSAAPDAVSTSASPEHASNDPVELVIATSTPAVVSKSQSDTS